jgi:hypothetical protein
MRRRRGRLVLLQKAAEHYKDRGTDRQIDPEDERPAGMLDEKGAECRADDRGDTPYSRDVALDAGALGRTIDVADDGRGDRQNRTGTGTLQPAKQHQRHHAPGQSAECRAQQEQAQPGKEDVLAAVEIGKPAVDRDRHRLSQEVGGKGPAEEVKPAELGDYRRHRGGDDRDVHSCHEDRHHHGRQHQSPRRLSLGREVRLEILSDGRLIEQYAPDAKRDM